MKCFTLLATCILVNIQFTIGLSPNYGDLSSSGYRSLNYAEFEPDLQQTGGQIDFSKPDMSEHHIDHSLRSQMDENNDVPTVAMPLTTAQMMPLNNAHDKVSAERRSPRKSKSSGFHFELPAGSNNVFTYNPTPIIRSNPISGNVAWDLNTIGHFYSSMVPIDSQIPPTTTHSMPLSTLPHSNLLMTASHASLPPSSATTISNPASAPITNSIPLISSFGSAELQSNNNMNIVQFSNPLPTSTIQSSFLTSTAHNQYPTPTTSSDVAMAYLPIINNVPPTIKHQLVSVRKVIIPSPRLINDEDGSVFNTIEEFQRYKRSRHY